MTDPTVISLDEHRPHWSGPVVCNRCGWSWVAVRPVGTGLMECSKCGSISGASLSYMLALPEAFLGDQCCGQVDSAGTCCAPACIRGEALKLIDRIRLAYALEHEATP